MANRIKELLEEIKTELPEMKKQNKKDINIEMCIKKIEELECLLKTECPVFRKLYKDK